mmetsp:Transcript_95343/g.240237  ORF Transcript_95343/g.240237 Transcript_95343/m.240237 type:complete len:293 (+) Transcript_95343:74-952(+)
MSFSRVMTLDTGRFFSASESPSTAAAEAAAAEGPAEAEALCSPCSGGGACGGPGAPGTRCGVLVHCDLGHNRSPTLVLAFLVSAGLDLRTAYRRVLRARPTVDPLPPYRRALRSHEVALRGASSVGEEELFAMHITQIMEMLSGGPASREGIDEVEDCLAGAHFGQGLGLREASVAALVGEEEPPWPPLASSSCAAAASEEARCAEAEVEVEAGLQKWTGASLPSQTKEASRCTSCTLWQSLSKRRSSLLSLISPPRTAALRWYPEPRHAKPGFLWRRGPRRFTASRGCVSW